MVVFKTKNLLMLPITDICGYLRKYVPEQAIQPSFKRTIF